MGVDYYISKYVGFKINRDCSDKVAEFIRQNVHNGVLFRSDYDSDYLFLTSQEVLVCCGRLTQFITHDRITDERIYPQDSFEIITREQFGESIQFNQPETEFLEKMKEYDPHFELEYFKVAGRC